VGELHAWSKDGGRVFFTAGEIIYPQEPTRLQTGRPGLPSDFNAFLKIGEDGCVTLFTGEAGAGKTTIKEITNEIDAEETSALEEDIQKKRVLSLINKIQRNEEYIRLLQKKLRPVKTDFRKRRFGKGS
jgi:hypothetical protein